MMILHQVHAVFESILDWTKFSVRIPEKDIDELPKVWNTASSLT